MEIACVEYAYVSNIKICILIYVVTTALDAEAFVSVNNVSALIVICWLVEVKFLFPFFSF